MKIGLAGNPNSGKTTLFNALTGANQYVGNWPGVTVEKKEGQLRGEKDVTIVDLPGIYSLSPYTLEEIVARNFLLDDRPDVILNIIDGSNIERNLYLTTQLAELGIPMVVAVNMMDVVKKSGDKVDIKALSEALSCRVIGISAAKGEGLKELSALAIAAANDPAPALALMHSFGGRVEHTLAHIEEAVLHDLPEEMQRWYSIKLFERDENAIEKLGLPAESIAHIEGDITACEKELDDDSEGIITGERYTVIEGIVSKILKRSRSGNTNFSDKIDAIVTNRILALPIFAVVMFIVYYVSVTSVGTLLTDWTNDGLFGEGFRFFGNEVPGIPVLVGNLLDSLNVSGWLSSLILDGIVSGVGAVLGFVPQLLLLFVFLAFLEGCGYMARVAFIMDRIFRKFGLSGKSFIPILIGTGCGVPGIMASRTIENERDRRMTIMTTTFIPCSAKLPIIALIAGALFRGAWWVAPSAYFLGMAAIVVSGIILKRTKMFRGIVAPFIMELPAYHMPTVTYVLRSMWERGWSFIKRAGTIILLAMVLIWFTGNFGWSSGSFGMVDMEDSILAYIGKGIAWIFAPLGFGHWKAAVATLMGLIAKESVVGTFGVLYGFGEVAEDGSEVWSNLAASFTMLSGYAFLVFNLLCAPCFAAIGAIRREMNSAKWFWFAIGYQTCFAYVVALLVYQVGHLIATGNFSLGNVIVGIIVLAVIVLAIIKVARDKKKGKCAGCDLCDGLENRKCS